MKKLNKKGFTLIEMLVVIAIIAVLVAIIIPVVQTATEKAAAATNAANLRSIKAEATTDYLAGATETKGYVNFTAASGTGESATAASFTVNSTAPTAKKCGDCAKGATANILFDRDTEKIREIWDAYKGGDSDLWRKLWTIYTFIVWYDCYFKD